jgi:hypothetical protein
MSAAAAVIEEYDRRGGMEMSIIKGIEQLLVTGGMPMLISGPARPANPKRKIFVFTSDFDWTSPPPECSKLKNPCSYMPDRRFFKKGDTIEGNVVTNTLNSEPPSFLESGGMRIGFGGRGKQIIIPFYPMPMLSENPNFVFIRDIKLSGMPNVPSGVIVTQQMRYVEAKKGDKIFGVLSNGVAKKGDKGVLSNGPEGQFIRGVFGGLKVQVPIDAVEPIKSTAPSVPDQATNKMLAAPSSAYNLKEAATWALGFSALLVFLKWADII